MFTKSQGYCSIPIAVIPMLSMTNAASARPQHMFWTEVDNSAGFTDDILGPLTNLTGFRTFDLFVRLETGDTVSLASSGLGIDSGLSTTQSIYDHPVGGDTQTTPIENFENVEWDTFVALGDLDGSANPSQIGFVSPLNLSDPNSITAEWNPSLGLPKDFMLARPDAMNNMWLGRFTVSSAGLFGDATADTEFLGGQLFLSGEGTNGTFGREIAANGIVDVPNAFLIPTPSAIALFGLAGAAATRRRR